MEFLAKEIEDYSTNHTSSEPDYLYELYRETHQNVLMPRMLSGHLQGRTLSMISKMIQPKLIVEVGTYTGYSALCMAEGLAKDGKLITIDIEEELSEIQKKYFDASPFGGMIESVIANAVEYINKVPDEIDLVFIDADKENYSTYYAALLPKMRSGGVIIADNVLWSGKVLNEASSHDIETKALADFNKMVHEDGRVENVLLPIRDGLMVLRKL